MKTKINSQVYDTETSQEIVRWVKELPETYIIETLYRTQRKEFFIYAWSEPYGIYDDGVIIPATEQEARKGVQDYVRKYGNEDEIAAVFGDLDDGKESDFEGFVKKVEKPRVRLCVEYADGSQHDTCSYYDYMRCVDEMKDFLDKKLEAIFEDLEDHITDEDTDESIEAEKGSIEAEKEEIIEAMACGDDGCFSGVFFDMAWSIEHATESK